LSKEVENLDTNVYFSRTVGASDVILT